MDVLILAMLVVNLVNPLNSFKCSACQLVDQNRHRIQSQSTCFVNVFWVTFPQTPMLCMLIVFHTIPFVVKLSKGLVHYYYMPQASKILSTGIASIPLYKFTIRALSDIDLYSKNLNKFKNLNNFYFLGLFVYKIPAPCWNNNSMQYAKSCSSIITSSLW